MLLLSLAAHPNAAAAEPTAPAAGPSEGPAATLTAPGLPPPAQTRWEPFHKEAARTADGSLDVCTTMIFPLTIVPGVGDVVGTVGEWLCVLPAAVAVDYLGAFHGGHESHIWQPALALVAKKGWETLLDTPIMVLTIGAIVASVAGGVALAVVGGVPVTLVSAGGFGATLAVYLALKGGRDPIGNFLFEVIYELLTPAVEGEDLLAVQRSSGLQPGMTGVPAGFGPIATVASSKPEFDWAHAVPVMGPLWRADDYAKNVQTRTRRFAREVLLVEKRDLSTMDAVSDGLADVQGWSYAVAHVAIGAGLALFGVGFAVSMTDQQQEQQTTAEVLGGVGLGAFGVGGLAIVCGLAADRLQAVLVPAAWALAE